MSFEIIFSVLLPLLKPIFSYISIPTLFLTELRKIQIFHNFSLFVDINTPVLLLIIYRNIISNTDVKRI